MSKTTVAVLLVVGAIIGHSYISDNSYKKGFDDGYDEGYSVASEKYEAQIETVYEESYLDGYRDGINDGRKQTGTAKTYITSSGDIIKPKSSVTNSITVYITDTGTKYHKANCSYLKSRNAIDLDRAVQLGYSACSRCY